MAQGDYDMTKTTQQICKECGKVFTRSLYHPQITTCPQCKQGRAEHCIFCSHSHKCEWYLRCDITGKNVTHSKACKYFEADHFTPAQRREIIETLELVGGRKWI